MLIKELIQLSEASNLPDVHVEVDFKYKDYDHSGAQYNSGAFLIKCPNTTKADSLVKMLKTTKDKIWVQTLCAEIINIKGIDADEQTIKPGKPSVKQVDNDKSFVVQTLQLTDFLDLVELTLI